MILSFLLAVLALATLVPILAPLLRASRPVAGRATFDQAVYRDQLQELERDVARGVLTQAEAAAARLEIQRRLLAADRLPAAASRLSRSPVLAAAVFIVIGLGSLGLYLRLGAPGVPDEPFGSRPGELASADARQQLTMQQAVDRLAAKLKADPSSPQDWVLYARSLGMLSRWDEAESAYRRAMALGKAEPDIVAAHAEMLVLQAGGTVTPAAEAAFRQVLAADPGSGIARYYVAVAAAQAGEPRKAIDMLQALLADLPPDAPVRAEITQRIADAAQAAHISVPDLAKATTPLPGPDAQAVAASAAMPDEQRQAMIRGMVDRLAAKQQADPGNLDGWLQLARAYGVLREPDKAAEAFEAASRLKPDDVSIPLQETRTLLADHKPSDRLPARIVGLLKRAKALDPGQPMVLWYLGMAAAQDQKPDEARRYWAALLAKLAPGSEDARMIQAAMDSLAQGQPGSGG